MVEEDCCDICGKPVNMNCYRAYTSKCGDVIRCFEHADTGIDGFPDFGKDYCAECGSELKTYKLSEVKYGKYCPKCHQSRSGKNIRHVHGKHCIKKN